MNSGRFHLVRVCVLASALVLWTGGRTYAVPGTGAGGGNTGGGGNNGGGNNTGGTNNGGANNTGDSGNAGGNNGGANNTGGNNNGGGNNTGNNGNSGNPGGGANPGGNKPSRTPTAKVQGNYEIKIAGYYVGNGDAHATGAGVKIHADVVDPSGNKCNFDANKLDVVNDRFFGTGTVDGVTVTVEGRLDPRDKRRGDVLQKGRITFTFGDNNHFSRGAGEMK